MSIQFVQISCAQQGCHAIFGIPEPVVERLRETHENFMCPFGHLQSYPGKTDAEKLSETEKQLKKAREERESAQKKLRSQKLAAKKAAKK